MRLPVDDLRFLGLLAAWGVPYSWGAGSPASAVKGWPRGVQSVGAVDLGWDCSGFVQAALVHLGILDGAEPDRPVAGLYLMGNHVAEGEEQLGDIAFYGPENRPRHCMLVVAPGIVLGARGGDSTTHADNPRAFVQLEPLKYWALFVGIKRLSKAEVA